MRNGALDTQFDGDIHAWFRALREIPTGTMTEGDFKAWVEGPLRDFFPFDRFYGAYGRLSVHSIHTQSCVSSGHGPEFLASRPPVLAIGARGCIQWWLSHRRAIVLDKGIATNAAGAQTGPTEVEIDDISRFSLGALAQHIIIDPVTKAGIYFGFSGVPNNRLNHTLAALELIAPVLFSMYLQTKPIAEPATGLSSLTDRQRDLADLAALGLSDKAIASRLGISANTVGNHFRAIYAKLGIHKRSEVIALLK